MQRCVALQVADPRGATAAKAETNFEYDDNEWDIGIGDLIIDLDADIEKTNEKTSSEGNSSGGLAPMASAGKLAVEHSATCDKGLKMKIKRTKPGTKTSEAKHEIVKSGEQNGAALKRGSSGHRKDKARDKHEVNGVVRQPVVQRVVFPVTVGPTNGPGPPPGESVASPAAPPAPSLPPPPTLEEPKSVASPQAAATPPVDSSPPPPPPAKKSKTCSPSDSTIKKVNANLYYSSTVISTRVRLPVRVLR